MNSKKIFFIICFFCCAILTTARADDKCYTCHSVIEDKPAVIYKHDVHYAKGISCAGCHGGNPNEEDQEKAMDKKAGFVGIPKGDEISRACASCHSNADKM